MAHLGQADRLRGLTAVILVRSAKLWADWLASMNLYSSCMDTVLLDKVRRE